MDMVSIDIVLLVILCILTIFMCGYGFYCLYRLIKSLQLQILLRPTKVLFSHKNAVDSEQLRTVVAYRNPFTGDYCVHKTRAGPRGYMNALTPTSPDSGLSDQYEPLSIDPPDEPLPRGLHFMPHVEEDLRPDGDNSVNKNWNWNYKEYQI